jgi:hypothetical protein
MQPLTRTTQLLWVVAAALVAIWLVVAVGGLLG